MKLNISETSEAISGRERIVILRLNLNSNQKIRISIVCSVFRIKSTLHPLKCEILIFSNNIGVIAKCYKVFEINGPIQKKIESDSLFGFLKAYSIFRIKSILPHFAWEICILVAKIEVRWKIQAFFEIITKILLIWYFYGICVKSFVLKMVKSI